MKPGDDAWKGIDCLTHNWRPDEAIPCPGCYPKAVPEVYQPLPLHLQKGQTPKAEPPKPLDVQVGGGHYKDLKIQPVEYIHANGIPFIEGCVIKYVTRWKAKGGKKDLEKARHFIDLLISLEPN